MNKKAQFKPLKQLLLDCKEDYKVEIPHSCNMEYCFGQNEFDYILKIENRIVELRMIDNDSFKIVENGLFFNKNCFQWIEKEKPNESD